MAFIKLKDYLESLTTKGSISNSDLLPLLDSDASNAIKTVTKGTLVSLDDISGFTQFSQSVENQLANSSQFSESLDDTFAKDVEVATTASLINSSITTLTNNVSTTASLFDSSITQVSTDLSDYETDNTAVVRGIQSYTGSLKQAISVAGTDVTINGTLTTTNFFAQYVTSSFLVTTGSNQFGDNTIDKHEFTGSVYFADTVYLDGEPIGITALNAFSSSVNNSIIQIGNHTASIDNSVVQIGNHTSSVDNSVILFGAHTASQTTINSGISAVTGAFATELGEIQTTLTGHRNELNGIEAWTASLDDTFATDAQLYRLYQATRSLELNSGSVNNSVTLIGEHTASVDNSIVEIGNHTSSVDNSVTLIGEHTASVDNSVVLFGNHTASVNNSITLFGEHTASQTTINSGISAVTGAFATELGEIQTTLTGHRNELNGIESYTSSLKSVSIVSGSSQIDVTQTTNYGSINQYTDSDNLSYLNSLLVVSKSAGGDLAVTGDLTIGTDTALATAANRGNLTINGTNTSILSFGTSDALKSYVYNDGTNMKINTGDGILVVESQNVETLYVSSGSVNIKGQNPSVDGAILTLENSDTTIVADQTLGHLNFYTNDTSTTSAGGVGGIVVKAETNFDTSLTPTYMSFFTHDAVVNDGSTLGNVSEAMRLDSDRVLSLPQSSNNGTFNFNGTAMELDVNRHPETGVFSDTGKSHARISLNGANGSSEISFATSNANNTTATAKVTISGAGEVQVGTTSVTGNGVTIEKSGNHLFLRATSAPAGEYWNFDIDANNRLNVINDNSVGVYIDDAATSWTGTSDERLKNINYELTGSLSNLQDLRAVNYSWVSGSVDKNFYGLIAQDVEEHYPDMISEDRDGYKGIRYTEMIPVLVSAIKEQQSIIDDLKSRIETLENS